MRKIIFILTLILMICHTAMAEEISNYKLLICKDNQEAANLHVSCSFYLDFQCADSVSMNLGGGQEFSIENLTIKGDAFEYEYNGEAKNIVFHKRQNIRFTSAWSIATPICPLFHLWRRGCGIVGDQFR